MCIVETKEQMKESSGGWDGNHNHNTLNTNKCDQRFCAESFSVFKKQDLYYFKQTLQSDMYTVS